jgi:hypothetical protein
MGRAVISRECPRFAVAWLFVAGVLLVNVPQAVSAPSADPITDVALRPDGTLLGQVVSSSGVAVANLAVSLRLGGKEVAAGVTDGQGFFAFSGLRTGLCQVTTVRGSGYYRLWDARVAPPSSQPGAMIVAADRADNAVVRAQSTPGNWQRPMLLGAALGLGVGAGATAAIYESNRHPASHH